jgi:hypothetical protein
VSFFAGLLARLAIDHQLANICFRSHQDYCARRGPGFLPLDITAKTDTTDQMAISRMYQGIRVNVRTRQLTKYEQTLP